MSAEHPRQQGAIAAEHPREGRLQRGPDPVLRGLDDDVVLVDVRQVLHAGTVMVARPMRGAGGFA